MSNKIFVVCYSHEGEDFTYLAFWTPDERKAKDFCDDKNSAKAKYEFDLEIRKAEYEKWKKEKQYKRTSNITPQEERDKNSIIEEIVRLSSNKPDISKIPSDRQHIVLSNWQKKLDRSIAELDRMKIEFMNVFDRTNKAYNERMDLEFNKLFPLSDPPRDVVYHYEEISDEPPA
jgi:hypothetical protein